MFFRLFETSQLLCGHQRAVKGRMDHGKSDLAQTAVLFFFRSIQKRYASGPTPLTQHLQSSITTAAAFHK
jgi:hypothetical protein